jgi:hypothetical protein
VCKRTKGYSVSEIGGYQIAEALDLPLQPWAAFFQNASGEKRESFESIGILVERWREWELERPDRPLLEPARSHPQIVGRALALGVLRHGGEPPCWLVHGKDLRLIDLEFIGPFVWWPPQKVPMRDYAGFTEDALRKARLEVRKIADAEGILESLEVGLRTLTRLEFSSVLDFSGHPCGDSIKRAILCGLEARRRKLRRLLGCPLVSAAASKSTA